VQSKGVLPDDEFGPISGKAFANGTVAFAFSANWLGTYGIQPGYPKQKGEWDFAASIPQVGWWGGAMFLVPPQSKNQAEADKLALYCSTSPTFQSQVGTVPSYTGVYNVAGAFKPDPFFAHPAQTAAQLKQSAQNTAKGWTYGPNFTYMDTQAGAALTAMFNGMPVHQALQRLQSQTVSNLRLIGVKVK
jgi:ABC-type glycerol-3-phosphate transport system substrate-binding protein